MAFWQKISFFNKPAPRIGLALSGGAAHGMAHIGVLQALTEEGFEPDLLCGASAGSLIGLLFACGIAPMDILEIAKTLKWRDLISFRPSRFGLFNTDKVPRLLAKLTGDPDWDDLRFPFYPISFDYTSGETFCPRDLTPIEAVHASMSIPFVFKPFIYKGTALGDGGMTEIVPSKYCKRMGAERIIGVNVIAGGLKPFKEVKTIRGFFGQLKQIMLGHAYRPFVEFEDVYIVPDVNKYTVANLKPIQYYFDQGYTEAKKYMPRIWELRKLQGKRKK